ncbi:MAG: ABC transporter permease [Clostridiales bacterium]|jgi:ABC-2 type transport system permease protein|nr:ABC transporter permease [Clostridiales bacterium]
MTTMIVAARVELTKILWRTKYKMLLFVCALLCVPAGLLSLLGVRTDVATFTLPNAAFNTLSVFTAVVLPLIIFMLAADVYTHEIENKSIKCVLTRPVGRLTIFLSKAAAILCYAAIVLGLVFLVSASFQFLSSGRVLDEASRAFTAEQLLEAGAALAAYALSVVPMAAFVATAAFLAVLIPSPSLTMFLNIVAYIALSAVGALSTEVGAVLYTSYTGWYRMWMGGGMPPLRLITTLLLLVSHIAIFLAGGYLLFDRKDV